MIAKFALLCGACLCASATSPFPTDPPTIGNNDPRIALVECSGGSGSAVRIGAYTWVSVGHVTSASACAVAGEPIQNVWNDPSRDFSVFWLKPRPGKAFEIDCDGFKTGRVYKARGHARGIPEQTSVFVRYIGERSWGFSRLMGIFAVIPGQSGGGMFDRETDKLVGMINVFNAVQGAAGSVALSETHLCK